MKTEQFEMSDMKGRNRFLTDFKITNYKHLPTSSPIDLLITGKTGNEYGVEVKIFNPLKSITMYSGFTTIKRCKIEGFIKLMDENPKLQALFVIYLGDGILIFNLTNRIRQGVKYRSTIEPLSTVGDRKLIEVQVMDLCISPEMGDRIVSKIL